MRTPITDPDGLVARSVARLRDLGFRALPLPNLVYPCCDGLYLFRFGIGMIDVVVIRGHDAAVGARVRDTFDLADPIPAFETDAAGNGPGVLWSERGTVEQVVERFVPPLPAMRQCGRIAGTLDLVGN